MDKVIEGPKSQPCAVFVGHYLFEPAAEHAVLLGRLAKLADRASATFLTTLHPKVLDKSFTWGGDNAPAWQALRDLPEATRMGVAMPRFLLRLPYGDSTQSIDKFSYEELPLPPDKAHYLWGNPAIACAALLAQAFHQQGWAFKPGAATAIDNLPLHVYTVDDEQEVTLGETWLVRVQAEQLVKQGIMPVLCVRDQATMQLARFMSVAQPAKNQVCSDLQGPWTQAVAAAPPAPPAAPAATPETPAAAAQPAPQASAAPAEPAAPAAAEAPAEEEMDPDLAALLKQLE
jgi:type VI secretion system protein ImpC